MGSCGVTVGNPTAFRAQPSSTRADTKNGINMENPTGGGDGPSTYTRPIVKSGTDTGCFVSEVYGF